MRHNITTWRVLRSQQEMARNNARQALLVVQQRRREQAEADQALPLALPRQRDRRHGGPAGAAAG